MQNGNKTQNAENIVHHRQSIAEPEQQRNYPHDLHKNYDRRYRGS